MDDGGTNENIERWKQIWRETMDDGGTNENIESR
jgi:hypothetical protein